MYQYTFSSGYKRSRSAAFATSQGPLTVAQAYVAHGIQHILFGVDHLLFIRTASAREEPLDAGEDHHFLHPCPQHHSDPRNSRLHQHSGAHQIRWPKDALHWRKVHDATNEARARVTKAYTEMDEIDRNASLSSDIKYRQRCAIADQAIADFEASKTLARARQAIELAMGKYQVDQQVSREIAQDARPRPRLRASATREYA